ncbi:MULTISPECIES: alpha/beta fold hydrolase [unclassified Novosphingobium]|uniref:alpha/beta fold hydrolase n=1 Tax=Novosphingobium TaxID=165696 RepID=UPI0018091FDD|nr:MULTISPECIES: alpha/beta hydrolase [unclassified Novosphingobium]NKJ41058.1 pimeloyl-ACP methyl ester carboxylesterase [Novosphingobium sp. SG720]NMN03305.1 pimeloyl-ACP methyl ester carboxylesterase [Novosphingobium sp. SG919]NMN86705.1 pimeloyl-ACP methyl ester carboxylesterase [Novosphingobium sp. SG916]
MAIVDAHAAFEIRSWTSTDGLRLAYRAYAGDNARLPVICLPGLTRNGRDFEDLAAHLAAGGRRVLCPDLRGRGESDYARDPMTYQPPVYAQDLAGLLSAEGITRFIAVGTSLGGILTMMLAAGQPGLVAGAVLNDIGPVIEADGLARISDYVGQGRSYLTWMHAARGLRETMGDIYPDFSIEDWLRLAKRLMALGTGGRIAFDYDMKIAVPIEAANEAKEEAEAKARSGGDPVPPAADLWPLFMALAPVPLVVVHGALSDILSGETAAAMATRHPDCDLVSLPRVGHAPTLDEPEARAAIDRLLARLD